MIQEVIKKSSWVLVDVTESNCAIIARTMKQRSKEMDELAIELPHKLYRYVYRFWTKEEKREFFKTLLERHGLLTFTKNSNWSSSHSLILKEDFLAKAYIEWDAFKTAMPNHLWIQDPDKWYALYHHKMHFDGVIENNLEAVLFIGQMAIEAPDDNPVYKWYSPHVSYDDDAYTKARKETVKKYMEEKWDAYEDIRKTRVAIAQAHG